MVPLKNQDIQNMRLTEHEKELEARRATFSGSHVLTLSRSFLALARLCGCAGYHLGPSNGVEAGSKTIQINPVVNQTMEPRLGDAVTTALRKQLQSDGTYRLATHGDADIVVNGVITRFYRRELSLLPRDVITAQDYRLNAIGGVPPRG